MSSTLNYDEPLSDLVLKLQQMPLERLRDIWTHEHPDLVLPQRLPRDLLIRSITWKIQEQQEGGLSKRSEAKLAEYARQLATTGTLDIERSVRPRAGTRLIREWRGTTYVVEACADGFTMDGEHYASLSHAARAITGTRWSGPRFFGLTKKDKSNRDDSAL